MYGGDQPSDGGVAITAVQCGGSKKVNLITKFNSFCGHSLNNAISAVQNVYQIDGQTQFTHDPLLLRSPRCDQVIWVRHWNNRYRRKIATITDKHKIFLFLFPINSDLANETFVLCHLNDICSLTKLISAQETISNPSRAFGCATGKWVRDWESFARS